ncbi:uncharacterized protein LOC103316922 isoform X6 [Nasonia vitripennis]|uniref:Uncharacterized protein n=1 Tax=Nasonia vitripennis TaxID=7425 RepID=A0A7M7R3U6_NASVI|nr:uncharacterized protein LOC103316922 isoform X6 [Nasonia vitripennis]
MADLFKKCYGDILRALQAIRRIKSSYSWLIYIVKDHEESKTHKLNVIAFLNSAIMLCINVYSNWSLVLANRSEYVSSAFYTKLMESSIFYISKFFVSNTIYGGNSPSSYSTEYYNAKSSKRPWRF